MDTGAANCPLARRLAERGVRFVQLFHRGWDEHANLPKQVAGQCRDTDRTSAALVLDLKRQTQGLFYLPSPLIRSKEPVMPSAYPADGWTPCRRLPARLALCCLAVSLTSADQRKASNGVPEVKLWAGISIPQPVYVQREGATKRVQISFSVVNDGKRPVRPRLGESKLIINGEELKEWEFIVMNGPSDDRFDLLPAGDHILFAPDMSRYLNKPGIYRVSWKGPAFQSSELVFRVLPDKKAK